MKTTGKAQLLRSTLLAALAVVPGAASTAFAQQTGPAAEEKGDVVVITGSRIARQDYVANSPIVTVGEEQLAQVGSPTLDTLINQMPQFTPAITSTSNNPGNGGQANISLRGLGTNRTLVLMDGQRVVPSNRDGTVDINIIPAALVENIEVVTGGQSAVYGSDALAGVVNFKLRRDFEGAKVGLQYGITDAGDGEETAADITLGGNFGDGKGNAVVAFTYNHRDPIFNADRDFSSISGASGTTPYGGVDGLSGAGVTLAEANALFAGTYGAALAAVPSTFGFNADGTLFSQEANARNYRGNTTSIDYKTIPTLGTYNTGPLNELSVPQDRYTLFSRVTYDMSDTLHFSLDGNFANYNSKSILAPSPGSGNPGTGSFPGTGGTGFLVPAANPFVSADLRTLLNARDNPNAPFLIRSRFSNVGVRLSDNDYTVYQVGAGVKYEINENLTWNTYASFGHQERIETQSGNVAHSALRQLLEAADGGASLCTGGYNFINPNSVSASCIAYISRETKNQSIYEQRNIISDLQGSIFALPAGDVLFDVGVDYRSDKGIFRPDSVLSVPDISNTPSTVTNGLRNNAPGVVGFNAQGKVSGFIDVTELFGELAIPVLKDVPFAQSLNIDLSYRNSDYNTIGSVDTYKVGGDWEPIDGLRFRGGYSKATRAPSISELFNPAANNFPAVGTPSATSQSGDPCDVRSSFRINGGAAVRALCIAQGVPTASVDTYQFPNQQGQAIVGGNANLDPETADTYTVGFVYQPDFGVALLDDFSISLDLYEIKIEDFISAPDEPTFLKRCFNGAGDNPTLSNTNLFCQPINRDPSTGQLTGFIAVNQNLSKVQTKGLDFQVDWMAGLGQLGLSDEFGSVAVNFTGTLLDSFEVAALPGDKLVDYKGTIGNTFVSSVEVAHPEWKTTTNILYNYGPFQVGFRYRFIDEMAVVTGGTAKSKDYFDLTGRWTINDQLNLRVGIQNLTNKAPAYIPPGVQANTDPGTYDVYGRKFTASLQYTF
ncbi:MAG: TonB-dependent receptor [Hyphomonadaceae bacterium]